MRGPGLRLDLDVRRLWTCPVCGRKRRLSGDVPSPLCLCKEGGVFMQLTADAPVFKRAERLTPLPFTKIPLPEGWKLPEPEPEPAVELPVTEPPIAELPVAELPTAQQSVPEPVSQEEVPNDFGAQLDLPAEPPRESEPA